MIGFRKTLGSLFAMVLAFGLAASGAGGGYAVRAAGTDSAGSEAAGDAASDTGGSTDNNNAGDSRAGRDIYILFTSDVHCGVDSGFGYAGLQQVRDTLEAQGYETLLVDDGDAIQGDALGMISKGEQMIDLMNAMRYDAAIPGNHEFDYGMEQFLKLAEKAEFPYVSCNFNKEGELVFPPYVILEAAGIKIAFVGVTTPQTITTSTPKFFQDEDGNFIYGFMQDDTGEALYSAVQEAVDGARAEGADLVYVMGHLGNEEAASPWTYADVISHTDGIDVFLDGHSHDMDQVVMKNRVGKDVTRSAVGTKMACIGYSHISADGRIVDTGIWSWPNTVSAPELLDIHNEIREKVEEVNAELDRMTGEKVARAATELTINDPQEKDSSGNPVRMIRRAETNLGDLCADALRARTGADIGLQGGGAIRVSLEKGDITVKDILNVYPFNNMTCVIEASGQQILDALEWGARTVPSEYGGFLQVSGLEYEIQTEIENPCVTDENGLCAGIEGTRRVQNVKVGGEPIDTEKTYTVAGTDYYLLEHGDGYTAFDGAKVIQKDIEADYTNLIEYLSGLPGKEIGEGYEDPAGQGRITIIED